MITPADEVRLNLRPIITCPHCWEHFPPENSLWVAQHPELVEDPRLGDDAQHRFMPDRFDVHGNALDSREVVCKDLACPQCHLIIPRALFEMQPFYISVIGAPACGKSYFLSSMTYRSRTVFPQSFQISFADSDPVCNEILNAYEELQFFNPERGKLVKLPKTEEAGHLYHYVNMGDFTVTYPKPFFFSLRPSDSHPSAGEFTRAVSRVLVIYDNAGESFLPGRDSATNQVARHIAESQALLYLYDPTQDPRFRADCAQVSEDPQVHTSTVTARQELIFHEVASRLRKHASLDQHAKCDRPIIVTVTKYDVWAPLLKPLLNNAELMDPFQATDIEEMFALHVPYVEHVSKQLRKLLLKYSPELVKSVESFSNDVLFVPVSATGVSPSVENDSGALGMRPGDIKPFWVEIPLLYAFAKWSKGIIPEVVVGEGNMNMPG